MFPSQILISLIFNFLNQTEKPLVVTNINSANRFLSRVLETGIMRPQDDIEIEGPLLDRSPSLFQSQHVHAARRVQQKFGFRCVFLCFGINCATATDSFSE